MSELPEGWTSVRFDELFDFKGGTQPPKAEFSDSLKPGYIRLLQIRDFESDAKAVYIKDSNRWAKCAADDIMIGRYGASVGKVLGGKSGAYNVALVRIIFDTKTVSSDWARSYFNSEHFQAPLRQISRSAQNGFNKVDLAALEIGFPPLREQRRIAAKVDKLRKRSFRAQRELDRIPTLIERYKQAILAQAFSGELTADWRTEHRHTDTWDWATVGELADDMRYGTAAKCDYTKTPTPVLRIPNIDRGTILLDDLKYAKFTDSEIRKLTLHSGDLLFIRSNGSLGLVGRAAIVTDREVGLLYAGYLIRVRLDHQRVLPRFVLHLFSEPAVRAHIESLAKSTSGVNNINSEQLSAVIVPLPTLAEQDEIVRRIGIALAWLDKIATEYTRAEHLLPKLDQAILAKAFRGELVPQDSNDEPASALLDRISTARGKEPGASRPGRHSKS